MISKLLLITDGCRFCNIKETDNNKYITYVGSHFSSGSTAQPKLFVISQILTAEFCDQPNLSRILVYVIIRLQISAEFSSQPSIFFHIADWESTDMYWTF